jgi:Ternary complex associated domain 9
LLNSAVCQIVEDIWLRWYERAEAMTSPTARAFLDEALARDDCGWHISANEVSRLDDVLSDANRTIGYPSNGEPSAIWKKFMDWARTSPPVHWTKCVTHGDLHGGNIFLDPQSEEVWLIDFARTGRRLSTFDLATLEQQTMLQLLPTLLKKQELVKEYRYEFVDLFNRVERILVSPTAYGDIKLPAVRTNVENVARYADAVSALQGAARVVTGIRMQLHDTLKRRGNMADYLICLLMQSFRHMNVRGASDMESSNIGLLCSLLSSAAILETLMRTTENAADEAGPA